MTIPELRDMFAGQAMAGQMASRTERYSPPPPGVRPARSESIEEQAYRHADAMLAYRKAHPLPRPPQKPASTTRRRHP